MHFRFEFDMVSKSDEMKTVIGSAVFRAPRGLRQITSTSDSDNGIADRCNHIFFILFLPCEQRV